MQFLFLMKLKNEAYILEFVINKSNNKKLKINSPIPMNLLVNFLPCLER